MSTSPTSASRVAGSAISTASPTRQTGHSSPRWPNTARRSTVRWKLGGDQLLLQGGLHPQLRIYFYERLFSDLKALYPTLRLHALGAPEVAHIARISGLTTLETLRRLMAAGLDSLPGAGAEILDPVVRRAISPAKPSVEKWLDVMHEAHCLGLPTSATMMYGHVETPHQRVDHLLRIRDLQARCPEGNSYGFIAFIPWIFRSTGTELERQGVTQTVLSVGIPAHHRREPPCIVQYPQHPGLVAHRGQGHGTSRPAQRRQRHGVDHDRGKRRLLGRSAQPFRRRGHPRCHPRGGFHPSPARPAVRGRLGNMPRRPETLPGSPGKTQERNERKCVIRTSFRFLQQIRALSAYRSRMDSGPGTPIR